jgi:hypothetical protein
LRKPLLVVTQAQDARKDAEEAVEEAGQKAAEAEEAAARLAEASSELSAAEVLGDGVASARAGQALKRCRIVKPNMLSHSIFLIPVQGWHERSPRLPGY